MKTNAISYFLKELHNIAMHYFFACVYLLITLYNKVSYVNIS